VIRTREKYVRKIGKNIGEGNDTKMEAGEKSLPHSVVRRKTVWGSRGISNR